MSELFNSEDNFADAEKRPLAVRMRPKTLDEFIGQEHILGKNKILRRIIEKDALPSLIFHGPPGCGKTVLAMLIAASTRKHFSHINAVTSTVSDVREVISLARQRLRGEGKRTILFLDEIAHFNKLQQDALMKDMEEGAVILIGATTHNPGFYINTPLISRSSVFELYPLDDGDIEKILDRALKDTRGFGEMQVSVERAALKHLAAMSEGDARRALNTLEICVMSAAPDSGGVIKIGVEGIKEIMQYKVSGYDRSEDVHYDTISAFIKSVRGSDPDAALYWLAVMLAAGEDPRFIARRMLIASSEDIGNADPQAIVVASACYHAVEVVGMPECRIILAQAAIYLASAPKSNAAYKAIENACMEVKAKKIRQVPFHLRQGGYRGAEVSGRGVGYLYPHDFPGHYVPQEYMPPPEKRFYFPSESGYEKRISFFLNHIQRLKRDYEKKDKKAYSEKKKRD